MESVFYGGGIENHENRTNRLPRLLFNKMILSSYDKNNSESTAGQVNRIISDYFLDNPSQTVLDAYPCDGGVVESPADECGEAGEDWLTEFTWICTGRSALNGFIKSSSSNQAVYYIEYDLPYPKEYDIPWWHRQCYEKSCHCVSEFFLFGAFDNQLTDPVELEFNKQFRKHHYRKNMLLEHLD